LCEILFRACHNARSITIAEVLANTDNFQTEPLPEILILLEKLKSANDSLVFGRKLSDVAVSKMLKSVSYPEATVHGLRSSFRDWCGDNTNFSREVCEAALAHVIQNQTEAAYRRSDLFEKRRELMVKWGEYLLPEIQQDVLALIRLHND
jgi:integrase